MFPTIEAAVPPGLRRKELTMRDDVNCGETAANPCTASENAPNARPSRGRVTQARPSLPPRDNANGLRFILSVVRRWWQWLLPLGLLLGGGAAAAVIYTFEPSYEATACLRVDARSPYIAFESYSEDRDSNRSFVQTQIVLLHHPLVIGPMVANPEIARMPEIASQSDPVKWLSRHVVVKAEGESDLYNVSYVASDPQSAAKIVNALLDEYFRLRGQEDASRTDQVIRTLEQERDKRVREVSLMRELVRELAKQATGMDPYAGAAAESAVIVNHPLSELQSHLVSAEVEQEVLKARIKALKEVSAPEVTLSVAEMETKIQAHPDVQRCKSAIADLRAELQTLDTYSKRGANDPVYAQIAQQLQQHQKMIAQLHETLPKTIKTEQQAAAAAKRAEQIKALESDLESRQIAAGLLRARYDDQLKGMKRTNGDTLQLRFKQGELERAEKTYELISERIVKLRTEIGAPERVVCMKRAEAPTSPVEVFPYRNLMLAALAGFAVPFGLAFGVEKLSRRAGDASNLEDAARLPVVAEIARLPARRHLERRRGASTQQRLDMLMYDESINSLRTTLMLSQELRNARVLAVTSAVSHEGKTSLAAQLAMSIARTTNEPTLLIDGDLRSPNLHEIFDVELTPGLTKVLEEQLPMEAAIVRTACSTLDFLPAGRLRTSPHQLLANNSTSEALRKAIPERYRYVIVDTPPVLAASESLILASMADATLVCVLRDVSRIDQIKKAYQRLLAADGKPIGLVLNGIPPKAYAYHYGTYA
jgi:polysaccharide biosynthesis transport protein